MQQKEHTIVYTKEGAVIIEGNNIETDDRYYHEGVILKSKSNFSTNNDIKITHTIHPFELPNIPRLKLPAYERLSAEEVLTKYKNEAVAKGGIEEGQGISIILKAMEEYASQGKGYTEDDLRKAAKDGELNETDNEHLIEILKRQKQAKSVILNDKGEVVEVKY